MRVFGVVSTSLLFLLLGTGVAVHAQDQHEDAKPEAQQEDKARQEDKNAKQDEKQEEKQGEKKDQEVRHDDKAVKHDEKVEQNDHRMAEGHHEEARRIPDDKFRAHFGRAHTFRIGHPVIVGGRPQFRYGGYSFVMVDPWPMGWAYTDAVYVDYIDGMYYLIDPVHPGVRVVVNVAF
ncbi:MAG: hypothetical protein WBM11_17565 [Terriglobales bacterium]